MKRLSDRLVGKTPSKGKRLVVLHAITRDSFICQRDRDGYPIIERAFEGCRDQVKTAEWIWQANSKHKDYHKNMDGEGFEFWLENRLIPAFKAQFPGKRMILVMDNASYHHQLNTKYYPEGSTPASASKGINAHALRMAQCKFIQVVRGNTVHKFTVPKQEPAEYKDHREMGFDAPRSGKRSAVYARYPNSPSTEELQHPTQEWLKSERPEALDSKVEALFRENNWSIIWTPPYCPKFQPIELVWGVGKQRAGRLYFKGRTLEETRNHLRRGFYGGESHDKSKKWDEVHVAGCWRTARDEMDNWIRKDQDHVPNGRGLSGNIMNLSGVESWTSSHSSCLNIEDMDLDQEKELVITGEVEADPDDEDDSDVENE